MRTVEAAGSGFAFPSRTVCLSRDSGLDEDAKSTADAEARRLTAESAGGSA